MVSIHFAFACFGAGHASVRRLQSVCCDSAISPLWQPYHAPCSLMVPLAFVSHVDMAWGYSFMPAQSVVQTDGLKPLEAFQRAVHRILAGDPVAHALRDQYDRGLHLSSSLLETIAFQRRKAPVSPATIVHMWTQRNDARAYLLVGDPAADSGSTSWSGQSFGRRNRSLLNSAVLERLGLVASYE